MKQGCIFVFALHSRSASHTDEVIPQIQIFTFNALLLKAQIICET